MSHAITVSDVVGFILVGLVIAGLLFGALALFAKGMKD